MITVLLHGLILAGYLTSTLYYLRHFPSKQYRTGRYASGLFVAALIFHSAFLAFRGIQSGHLPIVGLYESMSFFAWLIAVVYLIIEYRFQDKSLGAFVVPLILMAHVISVLFMHPEDPLPDILRSSWFSVHVATSFLGYAAFFFAFITGLLYVLQMYYLNARRMGIVFSRLPALEMLDEMNLRATSIGWICLTIGFVTGVFWATQVWESMETWIRDPKVFCVAVTWVIYATQLVVRYTLGWQGKRAAYLAMVGFVSVLIAYLGAGMWTELHIFEE